MINATDVWDVHVGGWLNNWLGGNLDLDWICNLPYYVAFPKIQGLQ